MEKILIGGTEDNAVYKLQMKAINSSTSKSYPQGFGEIAVKTGSLKSEVKRKGFIIDNGTEALELREGDTLIVYVTVGGYEKWLNKYYIYQIIFPE